MTLDQFTVESIDHEQICLSAYQDKVVLIVNVASKCGFTKQYTGLQTLYRDYQHRGLVVLGFPCDQFGHQEPGDEEEIKQFCSLHYDVSFPMFSKIDVNGEHTDPLYGWLKSSKPGLFGTTAIKWNFTKFLINRQGQVVKRYSPHARPESLRNDIERLLSAH